MEGVCRPVGYGENSWLSMLVVGMVVLLALNVNNCRRFFKLFRQDLFGMRRRPNAFDDHTAHEKRTSVLIILVLCLSEGILLFSAFIKTGILPETAPAFSATMVLAGVSLCLYLFQLVACRVIGYAFADSFGASQFVRGFNASQMLLSFMILVPAIVALYYPSLSQAMLVVFAIAYVIARLLFISKGFMIFFDKVSSLLYFILYLCALEITPLLVIRAGSVELLGLF